MKLDKKSIFVFMVILLVALIFFSSKPLKVTDPNDPNFEPMAFSFRDYKDRESMFHFIVKTFPVGTDKTYIEEVLVNSGGAKSRMLENQYFTYRHKAYTGTWLTVDCPAKNEWTIHMKFNEEEKLTDFVKLNGPCL